MVNVSFCLLGRSVPAPFAGYVLPYVRARLARAEGKPCTVLGAIWNGFACAAAVAEWDDDAGEGALLSLFVDPKARRCGIAGRLVDLLAEEGSRRGAGALSCNYILKGEDLAAMDALFLRRGGSLENSSPVCGIDLNDLVDSPLIGPALRPGWTRSPETRLFSELTEEQLASFEAAEGLPDFLRPSALEGRLDPALSAAWVAHGTPVSFVAAFQTGERAFCQSSIWRGPDAPKGCLRSLICTQLNQCWYRSGGCFLFFVSPINPRSAAMAEWFTGGSYEPYAQRDALLPLGGRSQNV